MADNTINIDLVINAAQSAKTLAEQRKSLKELQSTLGQLEEGSDSFNRIAAAAGSLKDQIGDLRAQTNFYADDLRTLSGLSDIGQGLAAAFGLATSALEALGVGSDTAQEAIKKLEIAQTALNSIQAIGNLVQKESAGNILITNALKQIGISLTVAEGAAVEGLTVKQRILNLVQKASPMGILITIVGALTAAYALLSNKTKEVSEEQKALNDQLTKTRATGEAEIRTFNSQIEALKQYKTGSEERAIALEKINKQYGTTLKNLGDETAFLKQVNLAQNDYVAGAKRRIQTKINEQKAESFLTQAQEKIEQSRYAASKAREILDKNDTIRRAVKGKTDLEILRLKFQGEEGLEFQRLIGIKVNAKAEADALNKKADATLARNAQLLSKETAQEKAAREKKEKDAADAEAKRLAALNKADNKVVEVSKEALDTLLELRQKAQDDLIEQQIAYQNALANVEQKGYDESLSDLVSYNQQYLKYYVANQNEVLATTVAANNQSKNEELAAAKKKYDEVITQVNIGEDAKTQALEDYKAIQINIDKKYKLKEQQLQDTFAKDRETVEAELQQKIIQIQENARETYLGNLQANLNLAESSLISYNKKVAVLLQQQVPTFYFRETTNAVKAFVKEGKFWAEDLRGIKEEIYSGDGKYKTELDAINKEHRKSIKLALEESKITNESQKAMGLINYDRVKMNKGIDEANNKMAASFTLLLKKIRDEQIEKMKSKGITAETATEEEKAMMSQYKFINERSRIAVEYSKIMADVQTAQQSGDKEQIGYQETRLTKFKKENEYWQFNIAEQKETIRNWILLANQQIAYNDIFENMINKREVILEIVQEEAELNEANAKFTFAQRAALIVNGKAIKEFYNAQIQSNEEINKAIEKRQRKLDEINTSDFDYWQRAQYQLEAYVESSQTIANQLKEDGKRFDDFGRNWLYQILQIDSAENAAAKSKLKLVAEVTAASNQALLQNEQNEENLIKNSEKRLEAEKKAINKRSATKQEEIDTNFEAEQTAIKKKYEADSKGIKDTAKLNELAGEKFLDLIAAEKKKELALAKLAKNTETDLAEAVSNEKTILAEQQVNEKKRYEKDIEKITLDSALKQVQIEEDLEARKLAMRREALQEFLDLTIQATQIAADYITQTTDRNIANIERIKEAELEAFDESQELREMERNDATAADYQDVIRKRSVADQRLAIEDEFNNKIKAEKQRAFEAQKYASLIEIGINTAVEISKTLANPVLAVLVGLAGAAQAAFVAQQPTPEFALGGILEGPSHSEGGIPTKFGELEGGEAIINKKSTKKFKPLLSAINAAGGGVKFATGGVLATTQTTMIDNNGDLTEIKGLLKDFASRPILTYVNESDVTKAQRNQKRIEKRTTF